MQQKLKRGLIIQSLSPAFLLLVIRQEPETSITDKCIYLS